MSEVHATDESSMNHVPMVSLVVTKSEKVADQVIRDGIRAYLEVQPKNSKGGGGK